MGIFFAMLFWSGVRPRLLFLMATPGISLFLAFNTLAWSAWIIVFVLILIAWRPYVWDWTMFLAANVAMGAIAMPLWTRLAPYQQNRLLTFLNPEVDPRAAGYHAIQSRVAIGSGGWFGTGYTEGPQKRLAFLPEQHTDFVFSVVGEELGFLGVLVALGLFLTLFLVLLRIARRAADPFSSLVGLRHHRSVLHPRIRERRDDGQPHADHRHSASALLLWRLLLHHLLAVSRSGLEGCI